MRSNSSKSRNRTCRARCVSRYPGHRPHSACGNRVVRRCVRHRFRRNPPPTSPQPPFFDHLPEDAFGRRRAADISEANEQYLILITHNQQIIITKKISSQAFYNRYAQQLCKDTIKPSAKANFICILPRRSIYMRNRNMKSLRTDRRLLLLYLSSATLTSNTPDKMLLFRRTGLSPSCRKGRYDWHRVR